MYNSQTCIICADMPSFCRPGYTCEQICKRVLYIHASSFVTLTERHNFICKSYVCIRTKPNFQSCKCNDRKVLLLKFKAVGQTQAELHIFKVQKVV